jgi:L,D-transpeptidase YcbB
LCNLKIPHLYISLLTFITISCGTIEYEGDSTYNDGLLLNGMTEITPTIQSFSSIKTDTLFDEHLLQQLKEGYAMRQNKYIWVNKQGLTIEGKLVLDLFTNARSYGLSPDYYWLPINEEKSDANNYNETDELAIAQKFLLFSQHFLTGVLDNGFQKMSYNPISLVHDSLNLGELLIGNPVENLFAKSQQLTPSNEYHNLLKALDDYCKNRKITAEKVKVPIAKIDSVKSYAQARKALILHGYIDENASDVKLMEGLKLFQEHAGLEPDGKIGKYTSQALEKSTYDCWLQAALTLQKWRWEKDWPTDVFFVNIPSYMLRISEGQKFIQEHRVVVGTSWTPSPTLNSKLEYFILNPEWYVPTSITQGELIPKMQKDPTYLKRNNYTLVAKDGKTLDDIDWSSANSSNFKYTIKQGKGSSNALGLVKFIFKNPYSVYLHDTPSKSFFEKDIRSFSHGCIRVQHPFKLVEYILARENGEFTMDNVNEILANKSQKTVTPKLIYPIRIRYMCSTATSNEKLITHIDIYKKEEALLSILRQLLPCP